MKHYVFVFVFANKKKMIVSYFFSSSVYWIVSSFRISFNILKRECERGLDLYLISFFELISKNRQLTSTNLVFIFVYFLFNWYCPRNTYYIQTTERRYTHTHLFTMQCDDDLEIIISRYLLYNILLYMFMFSMVTTKKKYFL